jgi:hypothetical protein
MSIQGEESAERDAERRELMTDNYNNQRDVKLQLDCMVDVWKSVEKDSKTHHQYLNLVSHLVRVVEKADHPVEAVRSKDEGQ